MVRICKLGKTIPQRFAHRYYDAVTVGIDFTAREMQKKLREAGQPWELAKGFDGSEVSALLGRMPSAVGYQPTLASEMGAMQERRYLRTSLGETEDVIDEEHDVGSLTVLASVVTELLGNGQT